MEHVFLASLYMFQQPSATVLPFWNFRFKQIQDATGKTEVDVEAAKPVHLQKSLLRWSVSRCKDIFGNTKWGGEDAGKWQRRWFYVHSFMHTHGIPLSKSWPCRHRPQAEMEAPNPSWVFWAGHFAGGSQSNRVALWNKGQLGRSSPPTLCTPRRQDWMPKFPLKPQQLLGSAALLPGVTVPSIHPHSPNGLWCNRAGSVGNPRVSSTAWEIKTQRKDELDFCFLNRSLSCFSVL